jgi:ATP-dependent Clp protease adaptor protein ClpS
MSISLSNDNLKREIRLQEGETSLNKRDLLLYKNAEYGYKNMLDAIIEICDYDPIQAEQCAYLAYHKGFCQIKHDDSFRLKKMLKEFEKKGLWVQLI